MSGNYATARKPPLNFQNNDFAGKTILFFPSLERNLHKIREMRSAAHEITEKSLLASLEKRFSKKSREPPPGILSQMPASARHPGIRPEPPPEMTPRPFQCKILSFSQHFIVPAPARRSRFYNFLKNIVIIA